MAKDKTQYEWAYRRRLIGDPQKIGRWLENIRENNGGTCEPTDVVAAARDPRSPAHHLFEWDDTKAAEQHRITQAGSIIRHLRVTYESTGEPSEINAYFITTKDSKKGFRHVTQIMADRELREQIDHRALDELRSWERRYLPVLTMKGRSSCMAVLTEIAERLVKKRRNVA